jgi:hypothetical protein
MVKRRMSWRAGVRAAALAILVGAQACVTPTLPPDDPPEPDVELGVGVARLRGYVVVSPAYVFVHNRASGLVFGQRTEDGAYDFEVTTEPCDLLALWYTKGAFQSSAVSFRPAEVDGARGSCATASASETDAGH